MCMLQSEYHDYMPRRKPLDSFEWINCSLFTHPTRSCQNKIRVFILHTPLHPVSTVSLDVNRKLFSRKGVNIWLSDAIMLLCTCVHVHTHTRTFNFVYFQLNCKEKDSCHRLWSKNANLVIWLPTWIPHKYTKNLKGHNGITSLPLVSVT